MKYVFDGFAHANPDAFYAFVQPLGIPAFMLCLETSKKYLKERYCKKNELDEFPAEQEEALDAQTAAASDLKETMRHLLVSAGPRCETIHFDTDASFETTQKKLVHRFSPQVILLNHEKRLGVDTTCANLAIKFNMIYISVYQIIQ